MDNIIEKQEKSLLDKNPKDNYLIFSIKNMKCAISINEIREIISAQKLRNIPLSPPVIFGIISQRGEIITIKDIQVLLNLRKPIKYNVNNCKIILLESNNESIGIIVENIEGVIYIQQEEIKPLPSAMGIKGNDIVTGLYIYQKRPVIILKSDEIKKSLE